MNEPRIATLSPDIKKQETHLARDLQDVLACLEENPSQKVWLEFYPFLTAFLKLDPFWPSYL
ncbi:MAG: hypothetical protein K1Y36_22140 [Blastocatellia bacterium]|nr:hypothetical protein [Blastocatellia bacterium]